MGLSTKKQTGDSFIAIPRKNVWKYQPLKINEVKRNALKNVFHARNFIDFVASTKRDWS